ncbi:male sterility protein [Colletotrichum orchidophilum]|uniref:Male sterility protein n=1 Tax=Colletotrichum orchidophilum TaxID=1209926 RepID=A0A1G4BM86_9PEZI|nr:male sterility protein [Colletotrichum orchidophilum]OHF02524.1 male sterility protein [Colletotrichum orchidophilum]
MAPIAMSDLQSSPSTLTVDPTVFPAPDADEKLKKLWQLHGHPHSPTFTDPTLTSIATLIEHNARTQPSKPAFIHPVGGSFKVLDWAQLNQLCHAASRFYSEQFREAIIAANQTVQQPTVALLGVGNSISYLITQFALNRLRLRVLLLSNKNSPATRDHLLRVCNVAAIITDEANEPSLRGQSPCQLPATKLISLDELRRAGQDFREAKLAFETDDEWNLQSMIIHSSGSTGVPKPIIHSNRSLCQIARMYRLLPEFFIENWYLCFPLFHVAGLSIALSGLPTGLPTSMPPAQWPPAPSSILAAWKSLTGLGYPPDCLHCAPSVIEDIHEYITLTTKDYSPLTNLKVLQPGGAPLSSLMLSKLQCIGVNVKTTYGTTETGPPLRTIPHTRDNPDVYRFRNLYPDSEFVRMEAIADGLFECVVYRGFPLAAELWLEKTAPNPYRTGDLFLEDPPRSGYFVLQGRRDDILVHSNGEKTHAAALAMALEEDKAGVIAKTAVFGTGKPCPSVVVEINWSEVEKRSMSAVGLADEVWKVVQACNEKSPAYSRIPRKTVLILEKRKTLPVTPKGNVRRTVAWELYGDKVEELYNSFLGHQLDTEEAAELKGPSVSGIEIIQTVVADVFDLSVRDLGEDQNWYELGLDSLHAVEVRSKLVKFFGTFPLMFVFEYPTARKLLGFLQQLKKDGLDSKALVNSDHHEWIRSKIHRMNRKVDSWKTTQRQKGDSRTSGQVIYLTGASGALGNALLEVFIETPTVRTVYCAVRGADPQARVLDSLKNRGYAPSVYQSEKIVPVSYDVKNEKLGLDEETYQRLATEVTIVIHNAWKLDFNQPIQQFEDDCLRGAMHLMSFCLKGVEKTFNFMSSVAAAMGNPAGTRVPELPLPPDSDNALPTGYAQSKFIVEQVAQHYASSRNIPVRILRVGQLCGHSRLGAWNHTEMWPTMMMAGIDYLEAMPALQTRVDWLPVDICAEAIAGAVIPTASKPSFAVTNLVNPSVIPWDTLLSLLEKACGRTFEHIDMRQWVSRLEETAESRGLSVQELPALKLLGFFQSMAEEGGNGEGVIFESGSVEEGRLIDVDKVKRWLEVWRQTGHLRG